MDNIRQLPDVYRKDETSNNNKMLKINEYAIVDLKKDNAELMESLNLETATGATLELYGDMLGQERGLLDDKQYRYMLYTKIGQNTVGGDYQSVMDTLVRMFGINQGDITIEDFGLEESEKACAVKLTKFPLFVLVNAGFSSKQAVAMIKTLLPVCVSLYADNFEGTFEFAEFDGERDVKKGFADMEGKMGGFMGLAYGEDVDGVPEIPL